MRQYDKWENSRNKNNNRITGNLAGTRCTPVFDCCRVMEFEVFKESSEVERIHFPVTKHFAIKGHIWQNSLQQMSLVIYLLIFIMATVISGGMEQSLFLMNSHTEWSTYYTTNDISNTLIFYTNDANLRWLFVNNMHGSVKSSFI